MVQQGCAPTRRSSTKEEYGGDHPDLVSAAAGWLEAAAAAAGLSGVREVAIAETSVAGHARRLAVSTKGCVPSGFEVGGLVWWIDHDGLLCLPRWALECGRRGEAGSALLDHRNHPDLAAIAVSKAAFQFALRRSAAAPG